jgi:hypothetical protein
MVIDVISENSMIEDKKTDCGCADKKETNVESDCGCSSKKEVKTESKGCCE